MLAFCGDGVAIGGGQKVEFCPGEHGVQEVVMSGGQNVYGHDWSTEDELFGENR